MRKTCFTIITAIMVSISHASSAAAATASHAKSLSHDEQSTIMQHWTGDDSGWIAGFADYPAGVEHDWNFTSDRRQVPAPLTTAKQSLFIAGDNHSDDLFMFWKRKVTGLHPGARYRVTVSITFITNAPAHCAGVGGSPGESVYVKTGLIAQEPVAKMSQDGNVKMNIDKGHQGNGGKDAVVLGNIAGTNSDCKHRQWERKEVRTAKPFIVSAGSEGMLWLLIGTDSGFEARTELYYETVQVELDTDYPL